MLRELCLFLAVVLPGTCSALEIRRVAACSGVALQLRGDIKEGDYRRLKTYFKRREKIIGFDLSSDGGFSRRASGSQILPAAKSSPSTLPTNAIPFARMFFFAAKRYFGADSKIGVHAVSSYRDIEDVGSKLLTIKLARHWAEQGVPNSAIGKMVTTSPEAITYLDLADLSGLGASAGNPFAYKSETSSEGGQAQQHTCYSREARDAAK